MFHRQQGQIAQKSHKAQQKQQSTTYATAPQVTGAISAKLIQRAKDDPSSLSSDEVSALQETMGNRAVSRLLAQRNALPIQAKLTIGKPGDKYEQEADRIASVVVNQINSPVALNQAQTVQREMPEDKDKLQTKSLVQREMPEDKDPLQTKSLVQREYDGGVAAPAELESSIQQARRGGQPLADNVRQPMEQAFGADFSGVKVHTDAQADQLNQSIQARAFTTGQDVFFQHGEYNPGSRGGQELLAHELTHVVQQSGDTIQRSQFTDTLSQPKTEITKNVEQTIQRITEEDARQAIFTFGPRANAHGYTTEQLQTIMQHRYNEIQVGQQQSMRIGQGTEENSPLYGQIIYNCDLLQDGIYRIRITHAHGQGRMG